MRPSNDANDTLFKGAVSFHNTLQYHFFESSLGECAIFYLNKYIVEVLIEEMLFENFGEEDPNDNGDFIKGDKGEIITILNKRHDSSMPAKKCAMSIFNLKAA